jgi:hypothetical protein
MVFTMIGIAVLGTVRILGDRRFRARQDRPVPLGLRRARRAFLSAVALTIVSSVPLIGRLNGGPLRLAQIGTPATLVGMAALAASFAWLVREQFRIP